MPTGEDPTHRVRGILPGHDARDLVRCSRFHPEPRVELAAESVHGLRWLSSAEVAAGAVTFSPLHLAMHLAVPLAVHLARVLDQGLPHEVPEIPALG